METGGWGACATVNRLCELGRKGVGKVRVSYTFFKVD